jgi:GR25 family glycosyltransferase involved in LPS biosynthesis
MKIYCICLPERRVHTEEFFHKLGFNPVFTPIVTITDIEKIGLNGMLKNCIIDKPYYRELLQKTDDNELRKWYGKIACSMSHINAMNHLLNDGGDKALIFEDDNQIPDENDVKMINKRLKDILNELDQVKDWLFCNLSPCISNSNFQKSTNLYTGVLGYCMNAYLVTRKGVNFFHQAFPLSINYHTLDNYLPYISKKYQPKALDVHPKLFYQKNGHNNINDSGNYFEKPVAEEYAQELKTNEELPTILVTPTTILIIVMLILLIISIIFRKKYFIVISALGLVGSMYYHWVNKKDSFIIKNTLRLRDIKNIIPYLSTECNLYHGMLEYRLADVFLGDGPDANDYHLENFPNSFASQYIRKNVGHRNFEVLAEIIDNHRKTITLPEKNEVVVHLRCGDVMEDSDHTVEEMLEKDVLYNNGYAYIHSLEYYENIFRNLVNNGIVKMTIISGSHFEFDNYNKSCQYIEAIKLLANLYGMQTKLRLGSEPDDDVTYMVSATHFIPGKGGFSKIISKLREYLAPNS